MFKLGLSSQEHRKSMRPDDKPTHKGINAEPAHPKDATQPIDPACKSKGKTSTIDMIKIGHNGAKKNPRSEKQTAEVIKSGIVQMTISRAIDINVLYLSIRS